MRGTVCSPVYRSPAFCTEVFVRANCGANRIHRKHYSYVSRVLEDER